MRLKLYLLLLLALLSFPASAASRELVYGYAHFPPFMCADTKLHTGIDLLLVQEIGRRLGVRVVFRNYPFRRLLMNMKTGQIDIMTSLAKRPERERYMLYITPSYFSLGPAFYVQKGKENTISKYEDLYGITVGMSAGSAFFEPFDSDRTINKYPVNLEMQLLKMLEVGRINTFIGSNAQIDFLLRQQKLEEHIKKAVYRPEKVTQIYLALSRKSPFAKDAEKFNQVLQEIIKDGMIELLVNKQCDSDSL